MIKTFFLVTLFGISYGVVAQDEVINGNLAVGTSSRTDIGTLHVTSSNTSGLPVIRIESDTNSDLSFIRFQAKNASAIKKYSDISFDPDTENLTFKNPYNSAERMTIQSNGNVGIGTSSPNARLHLIHSGGEGNAPTISGNIATFQTNASAGYYASINVISGSNGKSSFFFGDKDSGAMGGFRYNNANNSLGFRTNGTDDRMFIDSSGKIGIGISSPDSKIHVNSSGSSAIRVTRNGSNIFGFEIGGSTFGLYDYTNSQYKWRTGNENVFLVESYGNVGIGTTTPDSKLTVKGNIHTNEVKVDLLGAVAPDYVFYKDYDLKTLQDVENYITETGHLPNIPSAKDMEAEGIKLKEMNLKLLEKIEELTLYTINQEKELLSQKIINENLEEKLKAQDTRLQKIEALLNSIKQ